jgi:hypothetical protein
MQPLGVYIQFDDLKKSLTIATPGNLMIVLNDKDKMITINDQNGNSIVMSPKGIDIASPKNINITAGQKINLKGKQGVNVESSAGDIQVDGLNIKETSKMKYSANAAATTEISSNATLTLKSALIMIN